jgi:hypothetical protein
MSVDGRGSSHRASLFSIDDKLTMPSGLISKKDCRKCIVMAALIVLKEAITIIRERQ